jgi:hypothetical protein
MTTFDIATRLPSWSRDVLMSETASSSFRTLLPANFACECEPRQVPRALAGAMHVALMQQSHAMILDPVIPERAFCACQISSAACLACAQVPATLHLRSRRPSGGAPCVCNCCMAPADAACGLGTADDHVLLEMASHWNVYRCKERPALLLQKSCCGSVTWSRRTGTRRPAARTAALTPPLASACWSMSCPRGCTVRPHHLAARSHFACCGLAGNSSTCI